MITGLEYVIAAYSIWIFSFIIYIFINKRSIKNLKNAVELFREKNSVTNNSEMISGKNENKK